MTARHYRRYPDGTREEVQHDTAEQALEHVVFEDRAILPPPIAARLRELAPLARRPSMCSWVSEQLTVIAEELEALP